ncbi:single-stranded DNA-binding protein [Diaminobutyricibacter tongyongensis]|uniref:Single-stranded DNA-binding protein n=1 Tax=Leifsonia tongyongensis TaxID=1268043 RepID=A0A6L9XZ62_9MICO|nr:single-stranded DNA-binding protein [Diaminobutyricibacter tongyongensis]NEN06596.1 single-stranded DNA-binding protein [Diaminobutyricibacter tongyongensis]
MNDSLSTRGLVATVPNHIVTSEGLPITSFRLAAAQRKFNRSTQSWETSDTNWYTVTAFRQLALNIAACVAKGDRIVVSGRLSIRDWESGERSGTVVEIDADAVGHDLTWGTSTYSRTLKRSEPAESQPAAGSTDAITQTAWGEADQPAPPGGLLTASEELRSDEDTDSDTGADSGSDTGADSGAAAAADEDASLVLSLDDAEALTVGSGSAP